MRILVIGDSCQDMFRYGICERLSPEAPVPVFKPTDTKINGGMSINVMENIKAFGVECDIVTNDIRPTKTRYVDQVSNQIIVRIDENDDVITEITSQLFELIQFEKYDAIVISDYNKGFLSDVAIEKITENHPLVFMDTKKKLGQWALGIEYLKINEKEYQENQEWLLTNNYYGGLIVTKGKNGAELDFGNKVFPIENEHPVRDLSGAGDTFLAALVVKYVENKNIDEAIKFANKCASWVVTQKGVVSIDPKMI